MLDISEPINVWAFFKGSKVTPYVFFWNKRRIVIEQINLMHQSRDEGSEIYHFSISAEGNFYRIRFVLKELKWFMEEVEE